MKGYQRESLKIVKVRECSPRSIEFYFGFWTSSHPCLWRVVTLFWNLKIVAPQSPQSLQITMPFSKSGHIYFLVLVLLEVVDSFFVFLFCQSCASCWVVVCLFLQDDGQLQFTLLKAHILALLLFRDILVVDARGLLHAEWSRYDWIEHCSLL